MLNIFMLLQRGKMMLRQEQEIEHQQKVTGLLPPRTSKNFSTHQIVARNVRAQARQKKA